MGDRLHFIPSFRTAWEGNISAWLRWRGRLHTLKQANFGVCSHFFSVSTQSTRNCVVGFLKKCLQHPFAPTLLRRAAQGWAPFHFDYWNTSLSKHRALNGVSVKHQFLPLYSRIWTKNGFPEEQSRGFLIYSLQDLQLSQTKLMFSSQQNIFQQERLFNEYISTVMHIGGNC